MLTYCINNADLPSPPPPPKPPPVPTVGTISTAHKVAIAALVTFDARDVKRIIGCSLATARAFLRAYHADGKIKTETERLAELYPPVDATE